MDFFTHLTQAAVSLPDFSTTEDPGEFIKQIYTFSISIVGILVFVQFLRGGWLYLMAAGNVGNVAKAKSLMINAIVGAIILFSAYLILYVINPDLVRFKFNFNPSP